MDRPNARTPGGWVRLGRVAWCPEGGGRLASFGSGDKAIGFVFPRGRRGPGSRGGGVGRHWLRFVEHLGVGIGFVSPAPPVGRWPRLSLGRRDWRGQRLAAKTRP